MIINSALNAVFRLTDLVAVVLRKPLARLRLEVGPFYLDIVPKGKVEPDEGVRRIEQAKASLEEALSAVDEVRIAAERHQREAEAALARLAKLEESKGELEKEVELVREIARKDVGAFRRVAGIPSASDMKRERLVGFVTGVLASVLAAALCAGVVALYGWLSTTTELEVPS